MGERIGRQLTVDCMAIVLNEKFGFGYDRIMRVINAMETEYDAQHAALDGGNEADFAQEKLDQKLSAIVNGKGNFIPFKLRYRDIREIKYRRRKT